MFKSLLLALLLLVTPARAEVGVAYFAMQAFTKAQCTEALLVFKGVKSPALAVLWESFGSRTDCIDRFLNLSGSKTLEIHSMNETCHRLGRRCTKYDQPVFQDRAKEIAAFVKKKAGRAVFMVSTGLEDDLSTASFRKRVKILRKALPAEVLIVRNPNARNYDSSGADVTELHGDASRVFKRNACAYSNDGFMPDFKGTERSNKYFIQISDLYRAIDRAEASNCYNFIWFGNQGASSNGFIEPRKRHIELYHSAINSVNFILRRYQ